MEEVLKKENFARLIGRINKASSYLFYVSGEREIDNILAYFKSELNSSDGDLLIIRPEDSEGKKVIVSIKQIREVLHFVNLSPEKGAKIAAIVGAESMNRESGNAFLKTLEEPPANAVLLLFAYSDTLLPTIKSRCIIYNFRRHVFSDNDPDEEILKLLSDNFKLSSDTIESYIKGENLNKLIYTLEQYARTRLLKTKSLESAKFAKAVERAKREIKMNANPKLAIENLVLNYRSELRNFTR